MAHIDEQLFLDLNRQIKELQHENRRLQSSQVPRSVVIDVVDDHERTTLLQHEIISSQNVLHTFAFVKGKNVVINEQAARFLFSQYLALAPDGKLSKNHLGSLLQRRMIELSFGILTNQVKPQSFKHDQVFENSDQYKLELEISSAADNFLDLLTCLNPSVNASSNAYMSAVANKLRQQIFSSMTSYSVENSGRLFKELQELLLHEMNKYRTISNDRAIKEAKNLAIKMINLFYQLKSNDVREVRFFGNGGFLDRQTMDGGYDDDDEEFDFQIDFCYFPLITTIDKNGEEQVVSKAKVWLRSKDDPCFHKHEDVTLSLMAPIEELKKSQVNISNMEGYDIVQPITGCWRSGSSNCEPEKAALRKERDEWRKSYESICKEVETQKQESSDRIEKLTKQVTEYLEEKEAFELEAKALKDRQQTLDSENDDLKDKIEKLESTSREKQEREEKRVVEICEEIKEKEAEVQRELSAEIGMLRKQLQAAENQVVQYAEQEDYFLGEIKNLSFINQSKVIENHKDPARAPPSPIEDDFVLIDE
ncbi:hypothetical protein G9A89_017868 [Geosiphon pyriformis]|nr:hypothetical protein G9A89_017868 [Geosiphon pyriformis]